MSKGGISQTQRMALLWCGLLAPAAELFPNLLLPAAGRGAWLALAAAGPLVLAAGGLLGALSGEEGLAESIRRRFGAVFGRAILIIYMVWAQLLLALRLRLCAERLLSAGERDGSLWFFLLAVAAVSLWFGMGSLSAFARAGQLFLAAVAVCGGVVLVLAAARVRPERLWPIWTGEAAAALQQGGTAAGVLSWGLYAAFLGDGAKRSAGRSWLLWSAGGCLVLAAAQAVILGALGANLAQRLDAPFFALAKSVGVEGAFQRVESVVAAVWLLADLALIGTLVFAQRAMAKAVLPSAREKWVAAGTLLAALALVPALFRQPGAARVWNEETVPGVGLLLGFGVPVLLWAAKHIFKEKR